MVDAAERLVNLALLLLNERRAVTVRRVRDEVEGYPPDQDEAAFLRMFERDKAALRDAGLILVAQDGPDGVAYTVDRDSTFAKDLDLSFEETMLLRSVASALANDPTFPLAGHLATALIKLAAPPVSSRAAASLASDDGSAHRDTRALAEAVVARKRASFEYVDAHGRHSVRNVEPHGIFLRDGRWYLVAHDIDASDFRVFAIRRISALSVNTSRPMTPDFDRVHDIDITDFARLPFEYGEMSVPATLVFSEEVSWRAPALTEGRGRLVGNTDSTLTWEVRAGNLDSLAAWVIRNGSGVKLAGPDEAVAAMRRGLEEVIASHGG